MRDRVKRQAKPLPAGHSVMRELNRSRVLDIVRKHSPISRVEIAKVAKLAKPTISAIVEDLLRDGLIREIGIGTASSGGGRPPILLEFNARSQFVLGILIGVDRTTIVVADARGSELGRVMVPTLKGPPAQALDRIAGSAEDAIRSAGVTRRRLAAVGVCVPGIVDMHNGTCLLAPNLGWDEVPVAQLIEERLRASVFVHNNAQAAAVAEHIEGAGQGYADMVLLYAETGAGAGILTDGHLQHGADGLAGQIGHCRIPGATGSCNCGRVGCLETVASHRAIVRAAERAIGARRKAGFTSPDPGAVAEAAAAGDEVAREIWAEAGTALGTAASWLVNLFNPRVLVVGGGLVDAGDSLLVPLREALEAQTLPHVLDRVAVRVWALGQEAKVRGAVLVALQQSETYYRLIFRG